MNRHLPVFFTAPHRVFFAGGCFQVLLALMFWSLELLGRVSGMAPGWSAPPSWLHAGLMLFGIFPWFILGFLMTALPKWMAHPPLLTREYLPPFLLMGLGGLLYDVGLLAGGLSFPGVLLASLGLLLAVVLLLRVTLKGVGERAHALAVVGLLSLGAVIFLIHGLALLRLDGALQAIAVTGGIWWFLVPLFFVVLHRMLPFFTSAMIPLVPVWRPMGVLWLMLAAVAGHGLLQVLNLPTLLVDAVTAVLAWVCLVRWGFQRTLKIPMLAMLHLAWFWASLAFTLYFFQSLLALFGVSWGGLAPLHMLGIGFFFSTVLGMGTRVSLGHSGRSIIKDRWGWRCFLLVQLGVALRLLGEFLPLGGSVNLLAVVLVLVAFGIWSGVHGPMYFRPRPDGQPG